MRRGVGGCSKTMPGAHACASTSGRSGDALGAGPRWAAMGTEDRTAAAAAALTKTAYLECIGVCPDKLLILQLLKPPGGVFEVFALHEFCNQALEVGDGFRVLIGFGQRLRQIEIDPV